VNHGHEEPAPPSLGEIGDRLREDLSMLRDAAERSRDQALDRVLGFVNEHPFAAVAVAFGAGFALSGALLSRTTARLAWLGGRLYLAQLMRGAIGESLLGLVGGAREEGGAQ
jgi:hypothetical protein